MKKTDEEAGAKELGFSGKDLAELVSATVEKGASFRLKARGFSMSPFIRDGDILTISPPEASDIALGKVIACRHPLNAGLVVHRMIGVQNGRYCLKGDNVSAADGFVPRENVLGVVGKIERAGRSVSLGLGKERVLIAFLSRLDFLGLLSLARVVKHLWSKKSEVRDAGNR